LLLQTGHEKTPATLSSWPLLSKYAEHLREMIVSGIKHPLMPEKALTAAAAAAAAANRL
jgi:hypothetical protein